MTDFLALGGNDELVGTFATPDEAKQAVLKSLGLTEADLDEEQGWDLAPVASTACTNHPAHGPWLLSAKREELGWVGTKETLRAHLLDDAGLDEEDLPDCLWA